MFVRKKINRSGTISVVVVNKAHGKFIEIKKFGVAKSRKKLRTYTKKQYYGYALMMDNKSLISITIVLGNWKKQSVW